VVDHTTAVARTPSEIALRLVNLVLSAPPQVRELEPEEDILALEKIGRAAFDSDVAAFKDLIDQIKSCDPQELAHALTNACWTNC
jgi:hypothetical protein